MKEISRKDFFKKTCLTGMCMCGFSSIAMSNTNKNSSQNEDTNGNELMIQNWVSNLLSNLDESLDDESKRNVLKGCSIVHYENLKMDDVLSPYKGNLNGFIEFLEEKWGWKIDYNKTTNTLIANENKDYCVCPILNSKNGANKSALCYCSEGFAEKIFSVVSGISASAEVVSSIQRGDEKCVYKVEFSN